MPDSTSNARYWKSRRRAWFLLAILAFLSALLTSLLVPANIPGLVAGQDYSLDFPTNPRNYRIFLAVAIVLLSLLWLLSRFYQPLRARLSHKAQFLAAAGLALAVWDLLSSKLFVLQPPYFPGPVNLLAYIPGNWVNLLGHIGASSRLFIIGLLLGTLAGIGTGILIGWFRQWFYWLMPVLKFTGVVPATAWMPLATVLLKPAPVAMTFLLVIASWFVIAFTMAQGMQSTPKQLYEVSRTLGASRSFLLFHVAIPNAMPAVFTGISTATALSMVTLVAAEMMGATAGLGYFINYSKAFNKYYQVYAAIIIMFIVFSTLLAVIEALRNRVLRWQKGLTA
jgi:NitT/TauT family transport system permease protein